MLDTASIYPLTVAERIRLQVLHFLSLKLNILPLCCQVPFIIRTSAYAAFTPTLLFPLVL